METKELQSGKWLLKQGRLFISEGKLRMSTGVLRLTGGSWTSGKTMVRLPLRYRRKLL